MRTPMPLLEQIEALRRYRRTLQADIRRAAREESAHWRKHRVSPFVQSLRSQRRNAAYELLDVADECLKRLRHAHALNVAEFTPGSVVTLTVVMPGYARGPSRHVIYDVEASARHSYHYLAWQLTTKGRLFERGTELMCPSRAIRITRNDDLLPEETREQCEQFCQRARKFYDETRDRGAIDEILKLVREQRARSIWW